MKICTKCKCVLPYSAFRPNQKLRDGYNSWCRDCAVQATKDWRASNPAYQEASKQVKKGEYTDAITYSRAICEHISAYTTNAIERFERRTGKEAPPYLAALRELSQSFALEHPATDGKSRPALRPCGDCGEVMAARHKTRIRCDACKRKVEAARARARRMVVL